MATRPFSMQTEPEFQSIVKLVRESDLAYGHLEMNLATDEEVKWAARGSAGVASYPDDGRTVEELVAKAATTMYTARAGGPGRIAFYSHPPRR